MKSILNWGTAFLALTFVSCGLLPSNDGNVDKIAWEKLQGTGYNLMIPDYMHILKEQINPDADFIYGNEIKEVYTMVIKENIAEVDESFTLLADAGYSPGLEGYAKFVQENINETSTEVKSMGAMRDHVVNGMKCKMFEVESTMDGMDIYYALNIVQGKDTYYQIYCWTLLDRKKQYSEVLDKILLSMQEEGNASAQ